MVDKTTQDLTEWVENYTSDLFSILNHKIIDHYLKKIHKPVNLENQVISRFFNEEGEWHDQKRPGDWPQVSYPDWSLSGT